MPTSERRVLLQTILTADEAFGATMLILAADRWPPDPKGQHQGCFDWTRQTLQLELNAVFGCHVAEGNIDRLMAAISIVTTDRFFQDPRTFIELANVLSGSDLEPGVFEPADSVECAWAITEALLLVGRQDHEPFSDEVRLVIGKAVSDDGLVAPPDVLRIAMGHVAIDTIATDWADDPEMFSGIYKTQQDRSSEITDVLRDSLERLLEQIRILPLELGEIAQFEKQIVGVLQGEIPKTPTEDSDDSPLL